MKLFAEILENDKESPKFFKAEALNKDDAIKKIDDEGKKPDWLGLNYTKRIHYCYHDEKINKPCETQNL